MNKENGKWITVNGTHIFLEDGQSFDEAIRKKFPRQNDLSNYEKSNRKVLTDNKDNGIMKEDLSKYKTKRLQSIVFDRISTYRKVLDKNEFVIFTIHYGENTYIIKLYNSFYDYEYEIIKRK